MNVNSLLERATSLVGDVAGRAERFTRQAGGVAEGLRHRVAGSEPKPGMDDVTLSRKVESIVFRPKGAPRGSVNVNTVDGIVYLHGEVKTPAQIKAIEGAVREIPEVRGVENLLHLPKTPARKAKPRAASARTRKPTPKVNAEKTKATGEPRPDELASRREGRQAAPLGAQDPEQRA